MIDRFQVVPAAYVIFRRGRQVLLQLRKNTGYRDGHWATGAAGHVEADESVLAAACREAAEEVGVVVAPGDLTPLTTMHRTHAESSADRRARGLLLPVQRVARRAPDHGVVEVGGVDLVRPPGAA